MRCRRFTTVQTSCGWKQIYKTVFEKYGHEQTELLFDKATAFNERFGSGFIAERGVRKGHGYVTE